MQYSFAIASTIQLFGRLTIEAYQFPTGEIRYAVSGACELLGLPKNYLRLVRGDLSRRLRAIGFTSEIITVCTPSAEAETLSKHDFLALARFAAYVLNRPEAQSVVSLAMSEVLATRTMRVVSARVPAHTD
jgi:hypothetical protein